MGVSARAGPWIPPIALMALIFFLSAQPNLSSGLGLIDLIGRKLVHMTEFGVLCLLWWRAVSTTTHRRRALPAAVVVAVLYAISDEFHQSFVDGRGASPVDVAIDTAGVAVAATLIARRRGAVLP